MVWVVRVVGVVGAVWAVGGAGMHWRPLNTLITKELQASGGLGGESGGVARVVWVVRVVGVVGAVWAVGGAGALKYSYY